MFQPAYLCLHLRWCDALRQHAVARDLQKVSEVVLRTIAGQAHHVTGLLGDEVCAPRWREGQDYSAHAVRLLCRSTAETAPTRDIEGSSPLYTAAPSMISEGCAGGGIQR